MGVTDVGATAIGALRLLCSLSDGARPSVFLVSLFVRWLSPHLHALTYGRRLLCLHGAQFPWGSRPRM